MKKIILSIGASVAAIALPAAAHAQAFAGVQGGYHDFGLDDDDRAELEDLGFDVSDGSPIFGVFAGYDFPMGTGAFAGVEGNFNIGTDVVDNEYGVAARFGFADEGGAKYYLRGGYQWVDVDPEEVVGTDFPPGTFDGVDTTGGDFLVGAGVDFPIGGNAMFRVNLDTVGFDTVRATGGVGFRF